MTDFLGANGKLTPQVAQADYALSRRNAAERATMAVLPRDAEVCACHTRAMNNRRGGRLQLWTSDPDRATVVLTR